MKKPWERAPLDEAVFLQEGPGIRSYEYQKGGYPMINVRCVQDGYIDLSTCNAANVELATGKWKHFQVQEGDILFTISGSIGRTAIVKKQDLPLLMNTSVVRFRSKTPRLRDDFYFYYLQSEDFLGKLHALSSGTAQKNVGPTHLKTLDVPLPPLAEQQRIVGLLDEAFEGLATAKANAEKNLQNARALFGSHLQSVFTQRGPGWVEKPLGDFCSFENGDRGTNYPSKSTRTATGIPFINAGHLTDDGIDLETMDFIPRERFDLLSNGKIRKGDILFCLRGSLGKFASVGDLSEGAIASSLVIVRPDKTVLNDFLVAYFRSPLCTAMINRFKNGAAQPNLSAQSLRNFIAPVPPLAKQESVVEQLTDLREETQRLARLYERKLAALEALKKSLLHQAFTGAL